MSQIKLRMILQLHPLLTLTLLLYEFSNLSSQPSLSQLKFNLNLQIIFFLLSCSLINNSNNRNKRQNRIKNSSNLNYYPQFHNRLLYKRLLRSLKIKCQNRIKIFKIVLSCRRYVIDLTLQWKFHKSRKQSQRQNTIKL